MARTVKLKPDASAIWRRSRNLPADKGFSPAEFRYLAVLDQLVQRPWVTHLEDIRGGLKDHVNLFLPGGIRDHNNELVKSQVIAVPQEYLVDEGQPIEGVYTPTEEPANHRRLALVRLLTPQVDGFCAMQSPIERPEEGRMTECPYCIPNEHAPNLHHELWNQGDVHYHVCEVCHARFTTHAVSRGGSLGSGEVHSGAAG